MIGLTRPLDKLGRIVIPKELRHSMGLKEGDEIEFKVVSAGILLSPLKNYCASCGSSKNLTVFDRFALCDSCLDHLNHQRERIVDETESSARKDAVQNLRGAN